MGEKLRIEVESVRAPSAPAAAPAAAPSEDKDMAKGGGHPLKALKRSFKRRMSGKAKAEPSKGAKGDIEMGTADDEEEEFLRNPSIGELTH